MQVESEHSGRMHVSAISSSGSVTFTTCLHGGSPWPEQPVRSPPAVRLTDILDMLLLGRVLLSRIQCRVPAAKH